MKEKNEVFNRVEKKYCITASQKEELLEKILPFLSKDMYFNYSIFNIYYDTEDNQLIRTSLDKPYYKEKLRLRCYGEYDETKMVYIELKKKFNTTVFKRRIALKAQEAFDYLDGDILPSSSSQIGNEIEYFKVHYHPRAKLFLAYDRTAYYVTNDPELRITFDSNIRYRYTNLDLTDHPENKFILDNEHFILEIKAHDSYPLWLVHALSSLHLYPTSFSKYGSIHAKEVKESMQNSNQYMHQKHNQPILEKEVF